MGGIFAALVGQGTDPNPAAPPTWMYGAIAAGVVVFLIFMVFMMKRGFRKAREATGNMTSGLERLGLQVVEQDRATMKLQGVYRGRQVSMVSDGSAVMKAGRSAAIGGIVAGVKGVAGIESSNPFKDSQKERKAKSKLQNAKIVLQWAVTLPLDSPVRVAITREEDDEYVAIGSDLYARFDPMAQAALSNPQVVQSLAQGNWDLITVKERQVRAIWAPPMKEYQRYAADPDTYADVSKRSLDALTTLCDGLYGPAA